jgi:flagellar motor switch/type III secretory pathway protein FliN
MDAAVQRAKETEPTPAEKPAKDLAEQYGWLPCQLSLEVPVLGFTVGDLLRLNKGCIVETACSQTSDLPLRANGLLIGWTEFEVIGNRLAVRITELA